MYTSNITMRCVRPTKVVHNITNAVFLVRY